MSLQVWLPLTKDLGNQGLSDLTFSPVSSATAQANNGKIGSQCYNNNTLNGGGLLSNKTINLGQKQSMFCWFRFTDLTSSSSLGAGLVSQHRYPANTGMGITIRYVSSTTGYLSVNTGNGSSRTFNAYYGTTLLQANTWYHGGYTYDGSTLKIYVNGVCEKTQTISGMSVPADYITCFSWSMGASTGNSVYSGYHLHGDLNDVRIYDHCLSEKEVKDIARGLIVHYPLTRGGFGQDNLATCTTPQYNLSASSGNYNYFWIASSAALEPNTTYTFSAEVTVSDNIQKCTIYNYTSSSAYGSIYHNFPADGKRHSWTFTTTSTALGLLGYAGNSGATANHSAVYKNIKIEKGSKATPYVPRNSETLYTTMNFGSTIEYDCSGYCNNGTRTGNFTWSSDTSKYNVSTAITASNGKITSPRSFSTTQPLTSDYTVALWTKIDSSASSTSSIYSGICKFSFQPSGPYISYSYSTSSNSTTGSSMSITTNVWYHIAMVYSQTDATITIYSNGKKHYTYTNKPTVYSCETQETLFGSGPPGLISDFRIYATALSADDIKSLYQNEAAFDDQGNILGPIR